MTDAPSYLQDAKALLTKDGFATSDTWYHGTTSALIGSINGSGLRRSGDNEMNRAAKSTMATIGNSYTESREPVFLTQSKELAFYWANEAVKRRGVRIEGDEVPVVFEVKLPESMQSNVRPDVGAASLLMVKEGEAFLAYLTGLYDQSGVGVLDIDLKAAQRDEYLAKLGMAYIDKDIAPGYVSLLTE